MQGGVEASFHSAVAGAEPGRIFSIFANSHSLLHSGQALRVFNHRWMQSRWNTWPQVPQAMLRPGCSVSPKGAGKEVQQRSGDMLSGAMLV